MFVVRLHLTSFCMHGCRSLFIIFVYLYQSGYLFKVGLGEVRILEVALRYLIYAASFVQKLGLV